MIGQTISHYRITRELGAGGMGVVYEAVDTKLDRTVALKFLPPESVRDPDAKARFIHEAKAASSLDHPNICTIYDFEETDDGRLFIAMARYEGETLKDIVERGPLDIPEAVDLAIQTLEGLAKAHRLGIVHRDIKPANVFVTEDGLVKLLDFGIAKLVGQTQVTKTGSMLGTIHYMSPEQVQGEEVDRRADLWSVGVVLYEMLTGRLPFTGEHPPAVLYSILNTDPVPLTELRDDLPPELVQAVARCLSKVPTDRPQGVEDLLLLLKSQITAGATQTLRARASGVRLQVGGELVQPYPGLASFNERDAEFFHGRESSVETVWQKLRRGRLLAVTGPSGVGKTSFLRAGLIPAKPTDWGVIFTKPGATPLLSLREALVREISGDTEGIVALLRESDDDTDVATMKRWRAHHDEALVVLDQFEELFTLSPPAEQEKFADLLSRLTFEADVHILVSLRDDFLYHCRNHPGLIPLFESLTVLVPLTGPTLRRALVQPALDCGFQFEDETLVDEMMAEVEGERGALPLLGFSMARLWEHRDRENGLLTRQAYERMGTVSGALAQHAEAMMDRIGADKHPLVREIFRNLVTAQGTRAVQDREQILTVFGANDRPAAKAVLGELIDARLLTSYEVKDEDGAARQRIEIVHESLLKAWPRLVRWQTQDTDSAQLRDQLRQAAQLWDQKSRSDDLLWTGTAFQEFELWRERYPGGLSDKEAEFATAMKSRNLRRKRRRRLAVSGVFVALLAVLGVVGDLWQNSRLEARRSEAARLLNLAENADIEMDNTFVLALATASLEREDTPRARQLAIRAKNSAPIRQLLTTPGTMISTLAAPLSPIGDFLATVNEDGVLIWPRNGEDPRFLASEKTPSPVRTSALDIHPSGKNIAASRVPTDLDRESGEIDFLLTLWSVQDGELLRTWKVSQIYGCQFVLRGDPLFVDALVYPENNETFQWLRFSLGSNDPTKLGTIPSKKFHRSKDGLYCLYAHQEKIYLARMDSLTSPPQVVGSHDSPILKPVFNFDENLVGSVDEAGVVRVWSRQGDGDFDLVFDQYIDDSIEFLSGFDRSSSHLSYVKNNGSHVEAIDLNHPRARPIRFMPPRPFSSRAAYTPDDKWLTFAWVDERLGGGREVYFFSLDRSRPRQSVILPRDEGIFPEYFLPDGSKVVARVRMQELLLCEVDTPQPDYRSIWKNPFGRFESSAISPDGSVICVNNFREKRTLLIPLDGSEPKVLDGPQGIINGMDIDPGGRRVAVSGGQIWPEGMPDEPIITIHDLETGDKQILEAEGETGFYGVGFLPDEKLYSYSHEGFLLWDLQTGKHELLSDRKFTPVGPSDLDSTRRFLVVNTPQGVTLWDFEERSERILPLPTEGLNALAVSPGAEIVVAGMENAEVLVLHRDSTAPYSLIGHNEWVAAVWISPDAKEIRSAGADGLVLSWLVPGEPTLYNLPQAELLESLRALTNMRIEVDLEVKEGYRIEYDRFPGWETAPQW